MLAVTRVCGSKGKKEDEKKKRKRRTTCIVYIILRKRKERMDPERSIMEALSGCSP
jgi:hypothetical protein